jgi:hypothetical protein
VRAMTFVWALSLVREAAIQAGALSGWLSRCGVTMVIAFAQAKKKADVDEGLWLWTDVNTEGAVDYEGGCLPSSSAGGSN